MGQYFFLLNYDKKEYVNPWDIGTGAKFLEWSWNRSELFPFLLRKSDEGGGGDVNSDEWEHLGRWAGDRIALVGDYDSSEDYDIAQRTFKNISKEIYPEFVKFLAKEMGREISEEEKKMVPDLVLIPSDES